MYELIAAALLSFTSATCFAQSKETIAPKQEEAKPQASEIFTFVEQMPEFSGDLNKYLSENIRYPAEALKNDIQGRVVVKFVVREDGSITDSKVIRGIGSGCDEEALRIVNSMPKWKPGKQNGKPVAVNFNLPLSFKLK